MADKSKQQHLDHIAKEMKEIDFAMLNTHTKDGQIGARPMSNNRQVDYSGDSYYFTWEKSLMVDDIKSDPKVGLSFQGAPSPEGAPGTYIAIEGTADIVRDKAAFERHWVEDLERWFENGTETEGMVMLHIKATRAAYWGGENEGDFDID